MGVIEFQTCPLPIFRPAVGRHQLSRREQRTTFGLLFQHLRPALPAKHAKPPADPDLYEDYIIPVWPNLYPAGLPRRPQPDLEGLAVDAHLPEPVAPVGVEVELPRQHL